MTAPISEIFVSVQGEGLYCGQRQVFLRFAGCNLACGYCDEPASHNIAAAKALSPGEAAAEVIRLAKSGRTRNVSFTGGEPLLRWEFIKAMAPSLKKAGLRLHLETNGVLYRELSEVAGLADVIAMDIKLPSSTGQRPFWAAHKKFLAVAPAKTFIKTIVTSKTKMSDFQKAVKLAAAARAGLPFFIQPATARRGGVKPPPAKFLKEACCLAAAELSSVKILPQQHPVWGVK